MPSIAVKHPTQPLPLIPSAHCPERGGNSKRREIEANCFPWYFASSIRLLLWLGMGEAGPHSPACLVSNSKPDTSPFSVEIYWERRLWTSGELPFHIHPLSHYTKRAHISEDDMSLHLLLFSHSLAFFFISSFMWWYCELGTSRSLFLPIQLSQTFSYIFFSFPALKKLRLKLHLPTQTIVEKIYSDLTVTFGRYAFVSPNGTYKAGCKALRVNLKFEIVTVTAILTF